MNDAAVSAAEVRERVLKAFQELGVEPACVTESVLIRNGQYVGRQFRAGDLRAVWFAGDSDFKILHD